MTDAGTPQGSGFRSCYANAADKNEFFCSNEVKTSKYTKYNFVPLFLIQQFSRFANAYFLFVCILQTIPSVSITGGVPTSLVPLTFVLFFDALVTAREDYKRHCDDAEANARTTLTMRDGRFQPVPWRDIRVGDLLKVCWLMALAHF